MLISPSASPSPASLGGVRRAVWADRAARQGLALRKAKRAGQSGSSERREVVRVWVVVLVARRVRRVVFLVVLVRRLLTCFRRRRRLGGSGE